MKVQSRSLLDHGLVGHLYYSQIVSQTNPIFWASCSWGACATCWSWFMLRKNNTSHDLAPLHPSSFCSSVFSHRLLYVLLPPLFGVVFFNGFFCTIRKNCMGTVRMKTSKYQQIIHVLKKKPFKMENWKLDKKIPSDAS